MAPNKPAASTGYRTITSSGSPTGAGDRPAPSVLSVVHRYSDWKLWLIFFVAFQIAVTPAFAQVSTEYQLKAVFLWRLAQFTQWPSNAFENNDSPLAICVLGENPFGDALDEAVRGETAHGRKFLTQYQHSIEQVRTCHILYLTGVGPRQAKAIAAAVDGRSVLTVRDVDGLASAYETIVAFVTEQNKIKLRINVKAATAARLTLDPRLLRAADIVRDE